MRNKIRIQFGNNPAFYKTIERNIDTDMFSCSMLDSEEFDTENNDLLVPLNIEDYKKLQKCDLKNLKYLIPNEKTVQLCNHKMGFNDFLITNGYQEFLPELDESKLDYPFIYKTAIGGAGKNIEIIRDFNECKEYEDTYGSQEIFKQEYLLGKVEYTLHFIAYKGEIFYHSIRRFNFDDDFYIRGIRLRNQQTSSEKFASNDTLESTPYIHLFKNILKDLNYTGTGCFNYKMKDGVPMIFEINPRYGATLSKTINSYLLEYKKLIDAINSNQI